jgi:hypothetical protein
LSIVQVLFSPERKQLDALGYFGTVILERFSKSELNQIFKGIAAEAYRLNSKVEMALNHLGVDVVQKNKGYSLVVKEARRRCDFV